MGFKELEKFNEAMLAKQVWRFIHDKNSLFYRFFKAKYFPNGSIFDAKQSSGSYTWKSILKARQVITLGATWRVGDGKEISVFKDRWILRLVGGKITSNLPGLDSGTCVADLIDQQSSTWKSQVIENSFLPFKAQLIQAIPIRVSAQPNSLYWSYEKNGVYSVKSGYKLICEESRS